MLNNVPATINRSVRAVTLRHPNAMDVQVYRKVLKRTASGSLGGIANIGGLGSISGEDEADVGYVYLGDGKIVLCGIYQGQHVVDSNDALEAVTPQEALVECDANPGTDQWFQVEKFDLVMIEPGDGSMLVMECVDVFGAVNIPPYTRKLVLNPRDDLHYIAGLEGLYDAKPNED
jgi:hypothetical protein